MNKEQLDQILEKNKVQPVGNGYIDLIVQRDYYKAFIQDLIQNKIEIESFSWWEWCSGENECKYGLGGPKSNFFNGWFAELPIEIDDVHLSGKESKESIEFLNNLIESKRIEYRNEIINFKESNWLTPAIWLNVPDDWKNNNST